MNDLQNRDILFRIEGKCLCRKRETLVNGLETVYDLLKRSRPSNRSRKMFAFCFSIQSR